MEKTEEEPLALSISFKYLLAEVPQLKETRTVVATPSTPPSSSPSCWALRENPGRVPLPSLSGRSVLVEAGSSRLSLTGVRNS